MQQLVKAADRIEVIQRRQAKIIRQSWAAFIQRLTSGIVQDRVATLLGNHKIEEILRLVDAHVGRFANVLATTYADAAGKEADYWTGKLGLLQKASFNLADRRALDFVSRNRDLFVTSLTRQQREVVRQALIEGMRAGESPSQIARRFARTIGLTEEQRRAVESYQRALEAGNMEALRRASRNPRFDERVLVAIEGGNPLTANQIEMMLGAYTRNLRLARARAIAETEALKLTNAARNLAARQALEAAGRRGTKTWLHTSAAEPREAHLQMVGDTVGMDEAFVSPSGARLLYPGDTSLGAGARDIINCQCGVDYNLE